MYPACLWSWAPGHDGYPHAPVLITTIGLMGRNDEEALKMLEVSVGT